jgi:hypothetical protein
MASEPSSEVLYVRDVRPVLERHCAKCHGAKKQESGLRLDSVTAAVRGGDSGPAVVPGKAGESRLILAVMGGNDEVSKMPPEGPALAAAEIALLKTWIEQGAKAPADDVAKVAGADHWSFKRPVSSSLPNVSDPAWCQNAIDYYILARLDQEGLAPSPEADRATLIRRLSLDLLGSPPTPQEVESFVSDTRPDAYERLVDRLLASPAYGERWGRHWLDLARYADSNGYTRDFGREIWKYREWVIDAINRDLPFDQFTIEQIAGDMLPGATQEQIVATGFHRNTLINEEGGTDQEQFRVDAVADRVATTGSVFLGLTLGCARCHSHKFDPISQGEYYQLFAFLNNCDEPTVEAPSPLQIQRRELEKRAEIRGRIDGLEKQQEQLRPELEEMQKAWEKTVTPEMRARLPGPVQVAYDMPFEKRDAANKKLIEDYFRQTEGARSVFPLLDEIAQLRASEPKIPTTMVMRERDVPRETFIHRRGNFLDHGARVFPAVPAVLPPLSSVGWVSNPSKISDEISIQSETASQDGRVGDPSYSEATRLEFARWLVNSANPLTPRVVANRSWQHFFGSGIVETDDDFGTQGAPPTHPELLDWLAVEMVGSAERGARGGEHGAGGELGSGSSLPAPCSSPPSDLSWSVKQIHRLIVTSAAYRQSSRHRAELDEVDPQNKLLARQSRVRLDAEVIRDTALAASGLLTHKIGGPSVFPPQPDGVFEFTQDPKPWKTETDEDRYRRGMYTHIWRSSPYPAMTVFDAPDGNVTCTRRIRSNTPLQALTLANDTTFIECARALARRSLDDGAGDWPQRVERAFLLCFSRPPSNAERQRLVRLLNDQTRLYQYNPEAAQQLCTESIDGIPTDQLAAWIAVCRVLLNLDEFITRE